MISLEIQSFIERQLSSALNKETRIVRVNAVGGGSINHTYQVVSDSGQHLFLKVNSASQFPGLFKEERRGLEFLQQYIPTPAVIVEDTFGDTQLLVLEWVASGIRSAGFWKNFGEALARLHYQTHTSFGFPSNNYMGSLPQVNTPTVHWIDFFIQHRLRPQVELACRNGLMPAKWLEQFEKLYELLPFIFPREKPSLLHGDLWSGNFICDSQSQPVLIDPAVYYGHRSIDLAMTTLFGRFDKSFYEAYQYHFPFPANYEDQWNAANLYPLLIHLHLFGSGYLSSITQTLQDLVGSGKK